jgi:hypothetical protein
MREPTGTALGSAHRLETHSIAHRRNAPGQASRWRRLTAQCAASIADDTQAMLFGLADAGVELIVVEMSAAVP